MTDAERLKAYDDELSAEMPADLKDWWNNSRDEWPLVARRILQNRREHLEECYAEIERLRKDCGILRLTLRETCETFRTALERTK